MSKVAVITDPQYLAHTNGPYHPERPERLQVLYKMLDESPVGQKIIRLAPRAVTQEELQWVHSPEHVAQVAATQGHVVQLDPDTTTAPESYTAALLAAGGLLRGIDAVMAGEIDSAFAMVRPPGHHAEHDHAKGFCLFNNVAIGAEYAVRQHNLKRVMIVDYDVHHGNGTQHSFYERPDVFFTSLHRYPFYPGTGDYNEEGKGVGKGYTLNIPFIGGEGDEEYVKAFEERVIPVVRDYNPELILLSAGYDAHALDPLGGMNVTAQGFAAMTQQLLKVAQEKCQGRLVLTLEGGYDLKGLKDSVEACLETLIGE
jgi:acetoin utilization deacetylase AcuC-like enzyme